MWRACYHCVFWDDFQAYYDYQTSSHTPHIGVSSVYHLTHRLQLLSVSSYRSSCVAENVLRHRSIDHTTRTWRPWLLQLFRPMKYRDVTRNLDHTTQGVHYRAVCLCTLDRRFHRGTGTQLNSVLLPHANSSRTSSNCCVEHLHRWRSTTPSHLSRSGIRKKKNQMHQP